MSKLALHETLDVHELLTAKNLSLTKITTMKKLVSDPELEAIMEEDVTICTRHVEQLKELLSEGEDVQ